MIKIGRKMKNRGFTIVELLVVVLIMGVLSTLGYQISVDLNARQDMTNTINDITSNLKLARSLAITRQRPPKTVGEAENITTVAVAIIGAGNTTTMAINGISGFEILPFYNPRKKISTNGSVVVTMTPGTIYFTALEGKLAADAIGTPRAIDAPVSIGLSSTVIGITETIIINPNGTISR